MPLRLMSSLETWASRSTALPLTGPDLDVSHLAVPFCDQFVITPGLGTSVTAARVTLTCACPVLLEGHFSNPAEELAALLRTLKTR